MSDEPKSIEGLFVYLGRRETAKGKLNYAYRMVDANDGRSLGIDVEKELWFGKLLMKGQRVGFVLKAPYVSIESSMTIQSPRVYASYWSNPDDILAWLSKDRTLETKRAADRAIKAGQVDELKHQLEPLHKAYRDMSYSKRAAYLAYLIEYITRP